MISCVLAFDQFHKLLDLLHTQHHTTVAAAVVVATICNAASLVKICCRML
jgi:hypothetical protein